MITTKEQIIAELPLYGLCAESVEIDFARDGYRITLDDGTVGVFRQSDLEREHGLHDVFLCGLCEGKMSGEIWNRMQFCSGDGGPVRSMCETCAAALCRPMVPSQPSVLRETHCACGAELMGSGALFVGACGDCRASGKLMDGTTDEIARHRHAESLDVRIARNQPAPAQDTSHAWATPAHEWP